MLHTAGDFLKKEEVSMLLKAAGARLLTRPPPLVVHDSQYGPCTSFSLCEADGPVSGTKHKTSGGAMVVSHKWLMDSVSAFTVMPLGPYVVANRAAE